MDKFKYFLMVILSGAGVFTVAMFVMMAESLPMFVLLIAAILAWIVLLVLIAKDLKKEPKVLWIAQDGVWRAMDGSGRTIPILRTNNKLFDQDEIKEEA